MTPTKTVLDISQLGDPVLRQVATPVDDPQAPQTQALIDDLIVTMESGAGVGIAAPQVGVSQQIVVVASRPTLRYPKAPEMAAITLINPKILDHSTDTEPGWEGCLSVPGIRGVVPRYRTIHVLYLDRRGQQQQREFTDFVARIFQHEYDHLQGMVFLDRVASPKDMMTEQEYNKRVLL